MEEMSFWSVYGEAAKTAVGFFWGGNILQQS
jgi:hypothetical protein